MSQKIAKRIRRAVKDNSETLLTKKEYMKIEVPTKRDKKAYANYKALYNEAKRVYKHMSQNQKMRAW